LKYPIFFKCEKRSDTIEYKKYVLNNGECIIKKRMII